MEANGASISVYSQTIDLLQLVVSTLPCLSKMPACVFHHFIPSQKKSGLKMYPAKSIEVSTPKLSKFIVWHGFPRKLQTAKTNN